MKIELLGALDYEKLNKYLNEKVEELVSDNERISIYADALASSNLYNEENINLIDDLISYFEAKNTEYNLEFVKNLNALKEAIYNKSSEISKTIEIIKKSLIEQNDTLREKVLEAIEELKLLEKERRTNIVATSGRLSRFPGTVFEILETIEGRDFEKNVKFAKNVIGMGHESITDHDYCVFAIQDVSPVIEQTIIAERFSSFTIKSRREVDFSNVGFYTPDFHDENGNILKHNDKLKEEYKKYMESLFKKYSEFVELGIPKEDARFVLPYCYHSNIVMGVDAHTLKDMIIKYTKTKLSKIQELREFGEKLYAIAKENIPYIIDEIDKIPLIENDPVDEYLKEYVTDEKYQILDKPQLITCTQNIDDTILISSIMRRYQLDFERAANVYQIACKENPNFKKELMKKITFEGDKLELTQVSFEFQIPLSFAVLTHLTRHRTHHIMVPDFAPVVDLFQYKVPPKIAATCQEKFDDVFTYNKIVYDKFKGYGVRDEDLVYFTLSGNTVNIITNMDGKTVEHVLGLRECTKAQWETRNMAYGMHDEIDKVEGAETYSSVLGATCMTQGFCKEGKESCGKIKALEKKQ